MSSREFLNLCERYANDGSPSGFGVDGKLDETTNPFSHNDSFRLLAVKKDQFVKHEDDGDTQICGHKDDFFIHPMMTERYVRANVELQESEFLVTPTSSGRTVRVLCETGDYLKLDFDAVLGRTNRALTFKKAIAGVEVSRILENAARSGLLPKFTGFLPERGASVVWIDETTTAGCVYRSAGAMYSEGLSSNQNWVPFFSLLASDRTLENPSLLKVSERLTRYRENLVVELERTLNRIVYPAIDLFFQSALNFGLLIEFNAQNLLVAMDSKMRPSGIIFRDLMGLEKDFGYSSALWPQNFRSDPYKCISPTDPDYQIRHSFAFDFKLSHYVISPLIEFVGSKDQDAAAYLLAKARGRTDSWCASIEPGYFPPNAWYSHPKVLLTAERPYEEHTDPYLRR